MSRKGVPSLADQFEELSKLAAPGPWTTHERAHDWLIRSCPDGVFGGFVADCGLLSRGYDAEFIAFCGTHRDEVLAALRCLEQKQRSANDDDCDDEDEASHGPCRECGDALTSDEAHEIDDMYVGSCGNCMPRPWLDQAKERRGSLTLAATIENEWTRQENALRRRLAGDGYDRSAEFEELRESRTITFDFRPLPVRYADDGVVWKSDMRECSE